ncbi:hypothetical protein ODZ84_13280 [Chryseobacterium fluminis]|uniref:hypothetical protein n=1 Tax=Chryseobacterium fluminis TaxID=2983606 RepID=UPI00224E7CEA|nr:hypothetical protein [Chryseobacterium sp. MMS21-Ot14]UZT96198.1 hypothetical protein ODZ84_13280 [Chryseobacterium sp. MMS21-Ot14]
MIKNTLLFFFSIFSCCLYAQNQIYDGYPKGQFYYKGGELALLKEIKKIIISQNIQVCTNKEEKYVIPVIINNDASINFIKFSDSINIANNKCAYEFGMKIIPHLKNWEPAIIKNEKIRAIAEIEFHPFFLYYTNEDLRKNKMTEPEYSKGLKKFRDEVTDVLSRSLIKNENNSSMLVFSIDDNGDLTDVAIIDSKLNERDRKELAYRITKIGGKWKPATFNGVSFKKDLRISLRQEFSFEPERERQKYYDNYYNSMRFR